MQIEKQLKEILVNSLQINEEEISLDSSFEDDLGADSLDFVELLDAVEETFNIQIEENEIENIKTVRDMRNLIKKKL